MFLLDWVRGGLPSRDVVKYLDYMERSTDSDVVKNLPMNENTVDLSYLFMIFYFFSYINVYEFK